MEWLDDTAVHFIKYRSMFLENVKDTPMVVCFKFHRATRHRFDYTNAIDTVQDAMVNHGWIEDDNASIIVPRPTGFVYDKDNPGVWIWVK